MDGYLRNNRTLCFGTGGRNASEQLDGFVGIGTSANNDDAIRIFAGNLGCPVESTQTDLEIRLTIESFISDKYPTVQLARQPEILGGLLIMASSQGSDDLLVDGGGVFMPHWVFTF